MDAPVQGAGAHLVHGRAAGERKREGAVCGRYVAPLAPLRVRLGLAAAAGYCRVRGEDEEDGHGEEGDVEHGLRFWGGECVGWDGGIC